MNTSSTNTETTKTAPAPAVAGPAAWNRDEAEARYQELSRAERLPTRKSEDYRYTGLRGVEFDRVPSLAERSGELPAELASPDEAECFFGVLRSDAAEINPVHGSDSGVYVASLDQALEERPDAVRKAAALADGFEDDVFAWLAAARWQSGVFIHVPRGSVVREVMRVLHYFAPESSSNFFRVVILAEENSEFTYVDEFAGEGLLNGKHPFASGLVQVAAERGARVRYHQVQNWGRNVTGFVRQQVRAGRDAQVEFTSAQAGGAKVQFRTQLECLDRGAHIALKGAARGDEKQHFDFWVNACHGVPDTSSDMRYWTVMADQARSVFNGNIIISREGVRTDANQQAKNMVLSKKAVADAVPKLEIATDDVKCAHGAAIVPIDPDQLYYLRARGISRDDAELMIINGFTDPVLGALPTATLRDRMNEVFRSKHARVESGAPSAAGKEARL